MNLYHWIACSFVALSLTTGADTVLSPMVIKDNTTDLVENKIHRLMKRHHLPAFAMTIVDSGEVLYEKAFGYIDLEGQVPATPQSVFKVWSVAKLFTALEIFREVEDNIVDLDSPLNQYLPEFYVQSSFSGTDSVTIKSLLAHRSGLPRNSCTMNREDKGKQGMLDKFERASCECKMAWPVGSRYKYSNLGYDLLGRVIEENRGMGFAQYMKDSLLHQLGMFQSAFFTGDIPLSAEVAKGYEYYKRKFYPMEQPDINKVPSGNLYSSIEDLGVFLSLVLRNEIFNRDSTLFRMYRDHYSSDLDPETMGLGWKTTKLDNGALMAWHDGGPSEGIGALVAVVPDYNLGFAVVANGTSFGGNISVIFVREIAETILARREGKVTSPDQKKPRGSSSGHSLMDHEGNYITFGMPMRVKARKNKLKGRLSGIGLSLIPAGDSIFTVTNWMDKIGLTKIFRPPVDFDKLRISFSDSGLNEAGSMIINLDNVSFEHCPRYPEGTMVPDHWLGFLGDYKLAWRLPGNLVGPITDNLYSITLKKNIITMSGVFGPLLPIGQNQLRILSGSFAGEIMEYFPDSGHIIHQNAIYIPVKN